MLCKNCQKEFTITDADREFYRKTEVPEPTWCPDCRRLRRQNWRNERFLFYRDCSFSGKKILAEYPVESPFLIYRTDIWHSDAWQTPQKDYDPTRPFLEQWRELQLITPRAATFVSLETMENSDYCNSASYLKNCYMVFADQNSEDLYYAVYCYDTNSSADCFNVLDSELCYDSVDLKKCYNVSYSVNCQNCFDSYFLNDCVGCHNCFACVGLRNREYCWNNKQLTKEEYLTELAKTNFGDYAVREKLWQAAKDFWQKNIICRYYHGVKNLGVSGDYLNNCKNVSDSFDCHGLEDGHFCTNVTGAKDCFDYDKWGVEVEKIYESISVGYQCYNLKFCGSCWRNCTNLEYCDYCFSCRDCFGCVGLKKGKYCILNKQYGEKEYFTLVEKIKESMKRDATYGEFFPVKFSPYAFNNSMAADYFSYTKDEAEKNGLVWQEVDKKLPVPGRDLPLNIKDIKDEITKEILACANCGKNYKIIKQELDFYRKQNIPVPRQCFSCRHLLRMVLHNPRKLYPRQCMCENVSHGHNGQCQVKFETTYAPNRLERVYCEECYQREIY